MRALPLVICAGTIACHPTPGVPAPDWPGEPAESALLWNGARNAWGYNHRLNRLGNWVGPFVCDADACRTEVAHSAASGLGSDTAIWQGWSTLVHAPGVGFLAGSSAFEIDVPDGEGRPLERVEVVKVPAEGLLADRDDYHVVLAGYDLFALEDADMYQSASFEVGPVTFDEDEDALTFPVRLGLQVDCDVVECDGTWDVGGKIRTEVHYGAHVMWLLVAGDADQTRFTCTDEIRDYAWPDADSGGAELLVSDVALSDTLRSPLRDGTTWPVGALALQRLSLSLDTASHFVEIATALRGVAYDPHHSEARFTLDLFFKQWNTLTAERVASYTTAGAARGEATVCLLQLQDGSAELVRTSGAVEWDADGAPATDERAVDPVRLRLSGPAAGETP